MKPRKPGLRALSLSALALVVAVQALSGLDRALHFGLARSAPLDGSTVASLSEVHLWFTEEPDPGTVSVQILNASGEAAHAGDLTEDPEDGKQFSVAILHGLAEGSYSVAWRGMGADGHVVRGEFTFAVAAH